MVLHVLVVPVVGVVLVEAVAPEGFAAEGALEAVDGRVRGRVDHLLVELRVAFGGGQAALGQEVGMVEIDWGVAAARCRIDINHLDIFTDWAWRQVVLPSHIEDCFVDIDRFDAAPQRRVIGIDPQQATRRPLLWWVERLFKV